MRASNADRRRIGIVLLIALAIAIAAALSACGTSDKWVGTWVDVKDAKSGFVVKAGSNGSYNVADPDGTHAFVATLGSDGALHGQYDLTSQGLPGKKADITLTAMSKGHLGFTMAYNGQTVKYELKKR